MARFALGRVVTASATLATASTIILPASTIIAPAAANGRRFKN
jgi:hypothetical protein